ncbi:MAG: hypothetical protein ACRD29_24115 [Acidimicrobiales bacterium]
MQPERGQLLADQALVRLNSLTIWKLARFSSTTLPSVRDAVGHRRARSGSIVDNAVGSLPPWPIR